MRWRARRLIWLAPVIFLAGALLLGVAADWWLESSGGKALLERQLARGLGMPVRLQGNYRFQLFPRLRIAGRGLSIDTSPGMLPFAGCEEYSVAVELLPFLRGELRIAGIELRNGFVNLDNLPPGEAADVPDGDQASLELPQVALLRVEDFSVAYAEDGELLLEHLELVDFKAGNPARINLGASFPGDAPTDWKIDMQGNLHIDAVGVVSQLAIETMLIVREEMQLERISGQLTWDRSTDQFGLQLATPGDASLPYRLELRMDLLPEGSLSGELQGQYRLTPGAQPLELVTRFGVNSGQVDLPQLELHWNGQTIQGSGCLVLDGSSELNLQLTSEQLDLDSFRSLLPEGEDAGADLPLDLAVTLKVEEATMAGAQASGITVNIGEPPDCSAAVAEPGG